MACGRQSKKYRRRRDPIARERENILDQPRGIQHNRRLTQSHVAARSRNNSNVENQIESITSNILPERQSRTSSRSSITPQDTPSPSNQDLIAGTIQVSQSANQAESALMHTLLQDLRLNFPVQNQCNASDSDSSNNEIGSSILEGSSPRRYGQHEEDSPVENRPPYNLNYSHIVPYSKQTRILSFDMDPGEQWDRFEKGVAMYCYMVNAFPDTAESNAVSDKLAIEITSEELDFERFKYESSGLIRSEFRNVLTARRTSARRQVDTRMQKYKFATTLLPHDFRISGSKKQYLYLLDLFHFAKAGYTGHGEMFRNECIPRILNEVFFNINGRGGARVAPTPDPIPPTLICLTFTMIYFHMSTRSGYAQATNKETNLAIGTHWNKIYLDYLLRRTTKTQFIDWDSISSHYTDTIHKLQNRVQDDNDADMEADRELRLYDAVGDYEMIV
ncbi:hypothetical protein BDA99DRAFT_500166 [Phascolomyces articulosus]|uniref:DUF6532 domain-containing protein n=1 Tax=Phascolomyces articulosus TaxID=60185 RepID=A0AAD5KK81_9FUNG|nr:hypothetical protein BDA99DRAFT_500166 [Phascolomyces articulosus]